MGLCRHCTDTASFICADFVICCNLTIFSFFPFNTIKEFRRLVTIRETLILIQNSNSIEPETGKRRPDNPIPAILCSGSACAQRGNFAEVWEPAVTACGCDTSPTIVPLFFPVAATLEVIATSKPVARTLATGWAILVGYRTFAVPRENKWDVVNVLKTVRKITAVAVLGWDWLYSMGAMERGSEWEVLMTKI